MNCLPQLWCGAGELWCSGLETLDAVWEFRNKRSNAEPVNPFASSWFIPEKALPSSAHPGAALKQPSHEQQLPGIAP